MSPTFGTDDTGTTLLLRLFPLTQLTVNVVECIVGCTSLLELLNGAPCAVARCKSVSLVPHHVLHSAKLRPTNQVRV